MQPGIHAQERPDSLAVVIAETGATVTYAQLEAASNRLAHLFRSRGLQAGDHVAVLLANDASYFEVVWAGLRAGLYVTPINWHLGPEEAGYIVEDCGATVLVTSPRFTDVIDKMRDSLAGVSTLLSIGGDIDGFEDYASAVADHPITPIEDETEGALMFYSSGTTGRPKGIKPPLSGAPFGAMNPLMGLLAAIYGMSNESSYLCPAPLYHAAPLGWSTAAQRIGATVVVMERFDAAGALEAIQEHRITHAQFVPTHFVRMLRLPEADRTKYDISSLQKAIHAAAPCPVEVKVQMMEWLGPIIYEYYAGSEGNGFCAIGPDEWLEHRGSVGKPLIGTLHIVSEEGDEQPTGEVGQIWFESGAVFEYHNDPEKTKAAFDSHGWSTLGDVGYVDEDGFLYLTDRISHMIISGGVNIYPQEVENVLILHPAVADVAVIGVPDDEMGESVKAVVQLIDPSAANDELAAELITFSREHLAGFKCPRSVDFTDELPRLPTGKLLKRVLRDRYAAPPS